MSIEDDIAASDELIERIFSEFGLRGKSEDQVRLLVNEYRGIVGPDSPQRDKVALSVFRVYLEGFETGRNSPNGDSHGDEGEGMFY